MSTAAEPVTLTLTAPVTCPQCGAKFTGTWHQADAATEQRCPAGHLVAVSWPGWLSEGPVTVPEKN
jgi:hypothetical protein